ncbi:dTMP kinase [Streptomyces syringium]|uniref:dTMP kinase n=1 Tax=Streptomyces syringium TaxID=76729 RepID=A0ABS4YBR4_9ACTN|nr:AAA family ATPase [Streptomyces syringium]MBP2405950.1 dTMP kinase [Streptomyces syringium]
MNPLYGPYAPSSADRSGNPFVVCEGVSGVGKTTLVAAVAKRLKAATLHTLPEPLNPVSGTVNANLRPLPQFAFYLAGALHASDIAREASRRGPVIADRYVSSVVACHAAVHGLTVDQVTALLEPFRPYLAVPDITFYLRSSEGSLRERMRHKADVKQDDTDLLAVSGRLTSLLATFATVAESDPSAVVLDTDGRTPDDLASIVIDHLERRRA